MLANKLMGGAGAEEKLYVDDVFSTYLYTGNGSTQTITNGIDLAGKGGMVWIKHRVNQFGGNYQDGHYLANTENGGNRFLKTESTAATTTASTGLVFNSNGFSAPVDGGINYTSGSFASWTFRKAPKFFDVQTATLGTGNATVSFSGLSTLGMVIVKRTDSAGDWYVWHRSLTAGKLMYLNQTAAEATLGHITVSGTTLTLVDGTLADGNYVCYAFAHDTSADGMIQCGSFTTDGSGYFGVQNLGWEPQYVLFKKTNTVSGWFIFDVQRGWTVSGFGTGIYANTSQADTDFFGGTDYMHVVPTGFTGASGSAFFGPNTTVAYLAIRRPNKPPTSGTRVYEPILYTGNGGSQTVGTLSSIDLAFIRFQKYSTTNSHLYCRLMGNGIRLVTNLTNAVATQPNWMQFTNVAKGITVGPDTEENLTGKVYSSHFFRRAPGVFDVVCDTGTGAAHTINHNLGAVPELMIRKKRSDADNWIVYAGDATDYLILNSTAATADLDTIWNDTAPTASVFTVGTHDDVNQSTGTFVTYLFATLAGIQYINSYVGDGTTGRTINCGFSAGARFVCIKATSTTGSWWIFDSSRGIVAANDPALQLNSAAAEITSADAIDPTGVGFIVNQETTCNLNVNGVSYLVWAIA